MRSGLTVRTAGGLAGLIAVLWMTAGGTAGAATSTATSPSSPASPRPSPGADSWTVYHGDPAGRGVAACPGLVTTAASVWSTAALDGQLHGEPLASRGRVYVATENDTVYALSAATGKVVWSRHLATPVPASSLPC